MNKQFPLGSDLPIDGLLGGVCVFFVFCFLFFIFYPAKWMNIGEMNDSHFDLGDLSSNLLGEKTTK